MRLITALLVALPGVAFAAGGGSVSVPSQPQCETGKVYDQESKTCVNPQDARLDDSERMKAVRQYAYAGQLGHAASIMDTLGNANSDLALTYRGFVARKSGDLDAAATWYNAALEQNPDNHLARSYRAQGWVEAGLDDAARKELSIIRARGGRETWAEVSLRMTLQRGSGFSY